MHHWLSNSLSRPKERSSVITMPKGRFPHVRHPFRRWHYPHLRHRARGRRRERRQADAISISSQTEPSHTPRNPVTIQAKARPRGTSSSSGQQSNTLQNQTGTSWFTRSRHIPGGWHESQGTSWHPPLTLWDRRLIEQHIGPRPNSSVTHTPESRQLFECSCRLAVIKCRVCHLNCCRNCAYRNWRMCWLCAYRRTHPRARIQGVPTLDQFMWEDKRHWFMLSMNDHT